MTNLPPGCRVSDIPGNSHEDAIRESAEEELLFALIRATKLYFTVEQINTLWAEAAEVGHYEQEEDARLEAEAEARYYAQEAEAEEYYRRQYDQPE